MYPPELTEDELFYYMEVSDEKLSDLTAEIWEQIPSACVSDPARCTRLCQYWSVFKELQRRRQI
jgi:hypothetical protein